MNQILVASESGDPFMQQWKLNLLILWFGSFFTIAGITMVTPFLALFLQHNMKMTNTNEIALWSSLIFSANFLTSFFLQPIWGKLADKYGRKTMLLRSGFGMAIVTVLMGLAQSPLQLLLLRMLNGTIAGFNPAAVSLVSAMTPKERMGFAMGILQSGIVAGSIFGPLLGGILVNRVGYRLIFYITGTLLFFSTLFILWLVKESFDPKQTATAPNISIWEGCKQLLSIPPLQSVFATTFIIQFAMLSTISLLPLYVQKLHHSPENIALLVGLTSAVTGVSYIFCAPLFGKISDKVGAISILILCSISAACCLFPQAFVNTVWQLIMIRFLYGIFTSGLVPSIHTLIRNYTPAGMESRAYSLNSSILCLGNMIGPFVGAVLTTYIGIEGILIMSASCLLINAIWTYCCLSKVNYASYLKINN